MKRVVFLNENRHINGLIRITLSLYIYIVTHWIRDSCCLVVRSMYQMMTQEHKIHAHVCNFWRWHLERGLENWLLFSETVVLSVLTPPVTFCDTVSLSTTGKNLKGHTLYLGIRLYFFSMIDGVFCSLIFFSPYSIPCCYMLHKISPHEESKPKSLYYCKILTLSR